MSIAKALTFKRQRKAWQRQRERQRALRNLSLFPLNKDAPLHGLPARLIISLTSYPARFASLHLTIQSLLDQTIRADQVVLWIAYADMDRLPEAVRSLQGDRFRIGTCDDIRNFKKILPSLAEYPDAFILIADDDTYYHDNWLRDLVDSYLTGEPAIVFTRGHRPRYTADGRLAPYRSWIRNAIEEDGSTSQDILATGNGGVLYPPGSLPPQTADIELIHRLSATSDDVWLYFMRQRAGWPVRRVPGPKREYIEWSGTQDQSLTALHLTGTKDEHLQAMSDHFGISAGAPEGASRRTVTPSLRKRIYRLLTLKKLRKRLAERRKVRPALAEIAKFPKHPNAPKHGLPGELIVSLTSYPARFGTLDLTIKSLLDQSVKPDRIILWVDHSAMDAVPQPVRALEGEIFSVRPCDDIRSFTKIVPALVAFPDSFIVVADDDIYYPDFWLKQLVDAYDPKQPTIVYHRGHRLSYLSDGSLAPYREWERNVADDRSLIPGTGILPTGVGGVLYPPGSLPPRTTDVALLKQLSETCDDSWLYFMWRQTGWTAKRAPGQMPNLVEWPDTQAQALWSFHRGGKKDEHLRALSEYFGTP